MVKLRLPWPNSSTGCQLRIVWPPKMGPMKPIRLQITNKLQKKLYNVYDNLVLPVFCEFCPISRHGSRHYLCAVLKMRNRRQDNFFQLSISKVKVVGVNVVEEVLQVVSATCRFKKKNQRDTNSLDSFDLKKSVIVLLPV